MIGVILFALQGIGTPSGAEILIVGQRIDHVVTAVRIHQKTREADCWITRSSGDATIDWQMCEIAKQCAKSAPLKRTAQHGCYALAKQRYLETYKRRAAT